MQMTDRGLLALVRHEGIVPGPYLDVKRVWTFGIGHTAAAGPPDPATMPRGMPADLDGGIREAVRIFRTDLARDPAGERVARGDRVGHRVLSLQERRVTPPASMRRATGWPAMSRGSEMGRETRSSVPPRATAYSIRLPR